MEQNELVEEVRRLREAQTPWVPRVGDPIEVVPDFKYGEWVGVPLWCAGVQWDFVTLCHNVTVSDAWPPRHLGDYTDGFYINRAGEADDLRPRALLPDFDAEKAKAVHNIKCDHGPFLDVKAGRKVFEVRKNDRGYQVGDILHMTDNDTGETLDVSVGYILPGGQYGIADGYAVMGIAALSRPAGDVGKLVEDIYAQVQAGGVFSTDHEAERYLALSKLACQAADALSALSAPVDAGVELQCEQMLMVAQEARANGEDRAATHLEAATQKIRTLSRQIAAERQALEKVRKNIIDYAEAYYDRDGAQFFRQRTLPIIDAILAQHAPKEG